MNFSVSAFILGNFTKALQHHGIIKFSHEPVSAWVIGGEFALFFFGFEVYFYSLHRLMHIEPIYGWVHKTHHRSTAPNMMTGFSTSPVEALINGGFIPLLTALVTLHAPTMLLISPCNILMTLYVHSGIEILPSWWNRSWLTKWFITTTFHDQHHRYFRGNYGGHTTLMDRLFGTVRPSYETDFERATMRPMKG
jgi:sterol desaturase/sphingolipid hydroxylase (fatty acid hydroxylase superfamily)